jgi:hypothetical protein
VSTPIQFPREWEPQDIRVWFANHETCPNCGIVLREMFPMANLYPHWTGACKREQETPQPWAALEAERRKAGI